MLRTTVALNYGLLCEINRVIVLLRNLLKFVLLAIFPQECLQIIERVLSQDQLYSLHDLHTLSFANLLAEVTPPLMAQMQNELTTDELKFTNFFSSLRQTIIMVNTRQRLS